MRLDQYYSAMARQARERDLYFEGFYTRDPEPSTADRFMALVGMAGFLLGAVVMAIMAYELVPMTMCP